MSDEEENADHKRDVQQQAWLQLYGALKDVYAKYGGGEAYLRKERQEFNETMEHREAMIDAVLRKQ